MKFANFQTDSAKGIDSSSQNYPNGRNGKSLGLHTIPGRPVGGSQRDSVEAERYRGQQGDLFGTL